MINYRAQGLTGNPSISVSSINTNNNNINSGNGTITATSFIGNATGLSGNPNISVNSINTNNNNINAGTGTITAANIYSDTWRKSYSVLHVYRESNWGSGSRFMIQTNLVISEYYRPGLQWRWMFGVSSGDNKSFVWGFFCAMYDQNSNTFSTHTISGGGNISVYQNWDPWG
jgi:hypothetical protein